MNELFSRVYEAWRRKGVSKWSEKQQVGNPTSTTSHLKRRETKDAQGSAHLFLFLSFSLKKALFGK
jgi:hypothetical protein